ncbi:hypothetical protein M758_UG100300 [Ceratodon purpureus]|nr:hypothetical protein M758_UG100300 [Ceratodon purpureus]
MAHIKSIYLLNCSLGFALVSLIRNLAPSHVALHLNPCNLSERLRKLYTCTSRNEHSLRLIRE